MSLIVFISKKVFQFFIVVEPAFPPNFCNVNGTHIEHGSNLKTIKIFINIILKKPSAFLFTAHYTSLKSLKMNLMARVKNYN